MPVRSVHPREILITGASSGIGAALALDYAGPGVTLALGGRDAGRLAGVAAACQAQGARVEPSRVDVTDRAAMADWIAGTDARRPLDLVIANAGVAEGVSEGPGDFDLVRSIIAVNLIGTLNTLEPALAGMRARRRGQIALMSSVAALRGMPGAHGYCASKAAVKALAEGLRAPLRDEGIAISVILPGFVRTPMN
ncbi:MAG TPA: SDR family NAD(P)-dependent oxidoreductase, partial [Arenibaculum sp.]|nr:SDR family NAD(P)-dependent oxidoreductase [Arenibaculum sp.]